MTNHILFNGQPKAGSHLLFRISEIFGYGYPIEFKFWDKTPKDGEFMFWCQHLPWSKGNERTLEERGIKMVVIYRDPRDVIASFLRAVIDQNPNVLYYWHILRDFGAEKFANEAMLGIKKGETFGDGVSMVDYRMKWLSWKAVDNVLPVRFENLIGSRGGGNDASQLKTFIRICQFIGLKKDDKEYQEAVEKVFDPNSKTFIKGGKVGAWKKYLTENNLEFLEKLTGNLIQELGYNNKNDGVK